MILGIIVLFILKETTSNKICLHSRGQVDPIKSKV